MRSVTVIFVVLIAGGTLAADESDCKVVPMTLWAGEASLRKESLPKPVKLVIIQHAVTPEANTDEDCVRIGKAVRKYQMETLGFDDIGESFYICGNGKVYEGAGWGLVGAHTKGYNIKSIGISFLGNFSSHLPTEQALAAAKDLIACGVTNNNISGEYKLVGHRQVSSTISPGDTLQKEVETWPHWTDSEV